MKKLVLIILGGLTFINSFSQKINIIEINKPLVKNLKEIKIENEIFVTDFYVLKNKNIAGVLLKSKNWIKYREFKKIILIFENKYKVRFENKKSNYVSDYIGYNPYSNLKINIKSIFVGQNSYNKFFMVKIEFYNVDLIRKFWKNE